MSGSANAIIAPAPDALPIWTITGNPSDFPGKFVIRRDDVRAGGDPDTGVEHHVCDTLEEARAFAPSWTVRFDRDPNDDPVIVEVWL